MAKLAVESVSSSEFQLQVCRSGSCATSGQPQVEDTGLRVKKNGPALWTIAFIDKGAPETFVWTFFDARGNSVAHGSSTPAWNGDCSFTTTVTVDAL